ncbi:MAG: hypothetical protein GY859_20680 [Desulfobacterales bacterium]|nr:hypothetical protein [Desulfobacterales bacterium]
MELGRGLTRILETHDVLDALESFKEETWPGVWRKDFAKAFEMGPRTGGLVHERHEGAAARRRHRLVALSPLSWIHGDVATIEMIMARCIRSAK